MAATEDQIKRHLVLDLGFSRRNAEIAVEMFRAGELTKHEMVVMNYILLNPEPTRDEALLHKVGVDPVMWVADSLNYRITMNGGSSVSKSSTAANRSSYSFIPGVPTWTRDLCAFRKHRSKTRTRP